MTRVIPAGGGRRLALPGRSAVELVPGTAGGGQVTLRRVTIPPERGAAPARGPHRHECEEVMVVLAGAGTVTAGGRADPVGPGDVIVVCPGEPHQTRNSGDGDLVLLCFFPVGDLQRVTVELPGPQR
ncbi:MAG TPA: cupin domain-containing protein [Streptosporangiaceae bacterium]|nr:cupin domain-containing protein [Streptosporangiaceae bacterium]